MTDGSSSPLSSPPKSPLRHSPSPDSQATIELGSPARSTEDLASSSDRREALVEPAEDAEGGSTQGGATKDVDAAEKPVLHGSGKGGQSASQKRRASTNIAPTRFKKLRRAFSGRKSAQDKKWDAPVVYTKDNSPLAKADLRKILLHPDAWEILSLEEKQAVLAQFRDGTHILEAGTPEACPNTDSLSNDDNFRTDCARYCENLGEGRHDEEWLRQAWVAHYKNKDGKHDEFLRERFEEEWGWMLPEEAKPESAESGPGSEAKSTEPKGIPESAESGPGSEAKLTEPKGALDQPCSTVESPTEGRTLRKLRHAGPSIGSPPEGKPLRKLRHGGAPPIASPSEKKTPTKSERDDGIKRQGPEATLSQDAKPKARASKSTSSRLATPPSRDAKPKGSASKSPSPRASTSPSQGSSKARVSQGSDAGRFVADNRPV